MKILNIHEFLKQDIGTLFVKVDVQCDGKFMQLETDIMIFGGQIGDGIDFGYNNLLEVDTGHAESVECCVAVSDVLISANVSKKSFMLDFDCGGRDGCHDDNQLFAVYEQADIDQLFEQIKPFSSKEEHVFMGLEEAKEVWQDRANGSGVLIDPSLHNTAGKEPRWNTGKGGRVWLEGELRINELEAMLVMGRAQLKAAEDGVGLPPAINTICSAYHHDSWRVAIEITPSHEYIVRKTRDGDTREEIRGPWPMFPYAQSEFRSMVAALMGYLPFKGD